eukprot:gnl/TRDRNA2_/TRDRNA2_175526_c0_seq3.p1 gnl/TRDRNA2_/TRDRNA2_175526_c0~~gnl/TRDRNA2_/TRDRNA2_175526_c0_seq3.p1  ORF type:complete len:683 (-),score=143.11 gnl/TRDRNA2_/TRDRNA2_175526_c0_seq3:98-2146(-)
MYTPSATAVLYALVLVLWSTCASSLSVVANATGPVDFDFLKSSPVDFDFLKSSIVRITTIKAKWHWARPWDQHDLTASVGSGFLISVDPLEFATCAHVVDDGDKVLAQFPEFGREKFPCTVVTTCNEGDVAIVRVDNHEAVLKRLKSHGVEPTALKLQENTPAIGTDVVAAGFPLGQDHMKLSTGIISGINHVTFHHRNLAIQSTAIISSGNSGSPLLMKETGRVVGVNYAKSSSAAQINYAVPIWRLKQVIAKHREVHMSKDVPKPYHFRLTHSGLRLTPGALAFHLREGDGKRRCGTGPVISDILPNSVFLRAKPPVKKETFLVAFDGVELDAYGQGRRPEYIDELVDFEDLLWMREGTGEEEISFEACDAATGKKTKHTTTLGWREEEQGKGIRWIYEPRNEDVDWEIFGQLLFMELTENHINAMDGEYHKWALVGHLEPHARAHPVLAVKVHEPQGLANELLGLDSNDLAVVESVNGKKVANLAEFRAAFHPNRTDDGGNDDEEADADSEHEDNKKILPLLSKSGKIGRQQQQPTMLQVDQGDKKKDMIWSMRTEGGAEYAVKFEWALRLQLRKAQEKEEPWRMTEAPRKAAKRLGLLDKKKSSMIAQAGHEGFVHDVAAAEMVASEAGADCGKESTNPEVASSPLLVRERRGGEDVFADGGAAEVVDFLPGDNFQLW